MSHIHTNRYIYIISMSVCDKYIYTVNRLNGVSIVLAPLLPQLRLSFAQQTVCFDHHVHRPNVTVEVHRLFL
jgi:hypothetical protein